MFELDYFLIEEDGTCCAPPSAKETLLIKVLSEFKVMSLPVPSWDFG
jgi:hypothetical protein